MADDADGYLVDGGSFERIADGIRRVEHTDYNPPGNSRIIVRQATQEAWIVGTASADLVRNTAGGNIVPDVEPGDVYAVYAQYTYVKSGTAIAATYDQRNDRYTLPIVQPILRVVLTATLSHGSSASATVTKPDGTSGDTITVYDPSMIGSSYHFASGGVLQVYLNLSSGHYEWLAGPCRVAD